MIYLISSFAVLIGGATQGILGFGFVIVSLPIILLLVPSKAVIPMIVIIALVNTTVLSIEAINNITFKRIWPLFPASIPGILLGTLVLTKVNVSFIQIVVGAIIVVVTLMMLRGQRFLIKKEKIGFLPVGFLSGFLNGSISMGGPPLALFYSNQHFKKEEFRANFIVFNLFINVITIISFTYAGFITAETFKSSIFLIPAMILGTIVGIIISKKTNELIFSKLVLAVIAIVGFILLVSGIKSY